MPRKHLLSWMKAQQNEERMLKKATHQLNQPCLSDDVAINIEGPTTSLEVGRTATTSVSPLQEENDKLSDPEPDEEDPEAGDEETSVTVMPKSKKQVIQSENLELKVSHKCSILCINNHHSKVNVSVITIIIRN